MRKKIAVFVQEIRSDYNQALLKGIFDFYKDKDVDLFLSQIRIPIYEEDFFGMQYWTTLRVAACERIDAIIICTPTFCSNVSVEELNELLSPIAEKKVVSVTLPLNFNTTCNTSVSCKGAYSELVSHMIKNHGSKRFAFMSADINHSVEARARLNDFRNALKENNIEFDEDKVFYGNFMFDSAVEQLSKRYKSKEQIDFDTIFAANDKMAYGCISYLKSLGLKVPEDIKVVGYDDIPQASTDEITLTTVNQQIELQGKAAAKLALNYANGIENPKSVVIPAKPVYRDSCGCLTKKSAMYYASIADEKREALVRNNWCLSRIHSLLDNTQSDETLQIVFEKMYDLMGFNKINSAAVCLYKEPVFVDIGEIPKIPDTAELAFYVNYERGIREINTKYEFDLHKTYIPPKFESDVPKPILVQSIFYGDFSYGYIIVHADYETIQLYIIFLKILANEIAQAYKYTRNIEEKAELAKMNRDLNIKSYTDELTGLMNRRGLMKYGTDSISLSIQLEKNGVILFCDMDH